MKAIIVKSKVFVSNSRRCEMVEVEGRLLPFHDGVDLFNCKRKWWLRYSYDRCTGDFPSKKKAMGWYDRGGR